MEPPQTAIVPWADAVPRGHTRLSDTHYRDEGRLVDFVWWRGRWCVIAHELLEIEPDILGRLDRQAAAGEVGIVFEKVEV